MEAAPRYKYKLLTLLTPLTLLTLLTGRQGCINCGILVSGIRACGVSLEHMENIEMFSGETLVYGF